jgi:hypothetical protein
MGQVVIWHPATGQTAEVASTSLTAWRARGWVQLTERPGDEE